MHPRKLHLLALYENDLSASRLNDTLSLRVRKSLHVSAKGVSERRTLCSASLRLSFLRTMKPCLKGTVGLALCGASVSVHYLETISKIEGAISLPPPPANGFNLKPLRESETYWPSFFSFSLARYCMSASFQLAWLHWGTCWPDQLLSVNPACISVRRPWRGLQCLSVCVCDFEELSAGPALVQGFQGGNVYTSSFQELK